MHDVPETTTVWMSHGDQVHNAGPEFIPLAETSTCPIAAVKHQSRPVYGLQFHPEVSHTSYGALMLGNFLDRVCASPAPGRWRRSSKWRSSGSDAALGRPTVSSAGFPVESTRP